MFTGIVETTGRVEEILKEGSNRHFRISSAISDQLHTDQSVSHSGVCLTVTRVDGGSHWVTAIQETLSKSNLSGLTAGDVVNLERCMLNDGRFDGHIVQGHVDQTGEVVSVDDVGGSWVVKIKYDPNQGNVTVEKGSIAIDGVSVTCFDSVAGQFSVAIIPYTYEHTTFGRLKAGMRVNLEFDIIGKYVKRLMAL